MASPSLHVQHAPVGVTFEASSEHRLVINHLKPHGPSSRTRIATPLIAVDGQDRDRAYDRSE